MSLDESCLILAPKKTFVTLDLETTGLHPGVHGICQIGAWVTGEKEDHFKGYFLRDCDPNYPAFDTTARELIHRPVQCEQGAFAVNGFTRDRIDQSQALYYALREFKTFVDKWSNTQVIFVCHNTPFDIGYMRAAFRQAGFEDKLFRRTLDTISLGFAVYGEVLSLNELAAREGIVNGDAHDALADAYTTSKVLHRLLKKVSKG